MSYEPEARHELTGRLIGRSLKLAEKAAMVWRTGLVRLFQALAVYFEPYNAFLRFEEWMRGLARDLSPLFCPKFFLNSISYSLEGITEIDNDDMFMVGKTDVGVNGQEGEARLVRVTPTWSFSGCCGSFTSMMGESDADVELRQDVAPGLLLQILPSAAPTDFAARLLRRGRKNIAGGIRGESRRNSVNRSPRFGVVEIFHGSKLQEFHDFTAVAVHTARLDIPVWRGSGNNRGHYAQIPAPNKALIASNNTC
ncbi:hypothetical protein KSP40_PGU018060 [Platanthera guangdongensis]|uniref:Uncharacterized protein n=1 Tax=Platanthera guangdongensis TaxID=2320717 RepID=A0ABR2M9V2_9ASPA